MSAYVAHLAEMGSSDRTLAWTRQALAPLIDLCGQLDVLALRPHEAGAYLDRLTGALATQRSYWLCLHRACVWWVTSGWLAKDPTAELEAAMLARSVPLPWKRRGAKVGRGKAQLRGMPEVRAYLRAALALDRPDHRVAAVLPLLTGLSSGEVRHLRALDVDRDLGCLWIRGEEDRGPADAWDVKTAGRVREVPIPSVLREDIVALAAWHAGGLLLPSPKTGRRYDRTWLHALVRRVCETAKVTPVCPHGLRDTYSSMLRAEKRLALAEIGDVLGHQDGGRTAARHYVGSAEKGRVLEVIDGDG